MSNVESGINPVEGLSEIGKNLETVINNLPQDALLKVKGVFETVKEFAKGDK